jgi:hypothetical protein
MSTNSNDKRALVKFLKFKMKNNALSPVMESKQLNYSQEIPVQNKSIDQNVPTKNLTNFLKTVVLPEAEKT